MAAGAAKTIKDRAMLLIYRFISALLPALEEIEKEKRRKSEREKRRRIEGTRRKTSAT